VGEVSKLEGNQQDTALAWSIGCGDNIGANALMVEGMLRHSRCSEVRCEKPQQHRSPVAADKPQKPCSSHSGPQPTWIQDENDEALGQRLQAPADTNHRQKRSAKGHTDGS
jgi:hypothetical protein